jgi:hypothetical protein
MEVATHRHGCCVLQRCIDFANGQQRRRLVNEISSNALVLSQVCSEASVIPCISPFVVKCGDGEPAASCSALSSMASFCIVICLN